MSTLGWWLVPVLLVPLLGTPSVKLPGDDLGIRRFRTPPLGPNLSLGQTFTMTGAGLHAIELFPVSVEEHVSSRLRFDLYDIRNSFATLVRTAEVPAAELMRASSFRFEFSPIPDSKDRTYRVDLTAVGGVGVAFWATKGQRYDGGTMHANGRERWADLAFQVHAPAPSILTRLLTLRETNPVRADLVVGALLAVWLLLGFVLRSIEAMNRTTA